MVLPTARVGRDRNPVRQALLGSLGRVLRRAPRRLIVAPLVALAACGVTPHYLEVSPGYANGDNDFARPVSSFDSETYSVVVTLGWYLGPARAALDADVSAATSLSGLAYAVGSTTAEPVTVNVAQSQEQDAEAESEAQTSSEADAEADAEAETTDLLGIPGVTVPDSVSGALAFLIFAAGLAGLIWVLHKAGVPLPFLKGRRK